MTDSYSGPPLTRRERRERERAAETSAATAAGIAGQPGDAAAESPAASTVSAAQSAPELAETQAMSRDELGDYERQQQGDGHQPVDGLDAAFGDASSASDDSAQAHDAQADSAQADSAQAEAAQAEAAPSKVGRFFGRRRKQTTGADDDVAADEAPARDVSTTEPASDDVAAASDGRSSHAAADEPASVPSPAGASVPGPSLAVPGSVPFDEIQNLDTVDDDAIDAEEIDEVETPTQRVSAVRVADATPAELEDRRVIEAEAIDEEQTSGPTRTSRTPVIVNVVQDTSEHHISDLKQSVDGEGPGSSVGTGTSSITANALVLPITQLQDQVPIEGTDGVLVTGSIDLPDGFASSGRGRGAFDGADIDAASDESEVQNPETAPVRASRAVSSYANARVRIAPQRRRSNAWPVAIGAGAGVVVVGVAAAVIAALNLGWL